MEHNENAAFIGGLFIYGVIWIIFCLIVSSVGRKRKIGASAVFWISFFLSPFIGLIVALTSAEKEAPAAILTCKWCDFKTTTRTQFCQACGRDGAGLTIEDYKTKAAEKLQKPNE